MSRIERGVPAPPPPTIVKQVVGAAKPSGRRIPKKLSCLMIVLIVLAVIAGWVGWFVASAGLMRLPLFTPWFYREPAPIHLVTPGEPLEDSVSAQISDEATRRLQQGGGIIADRSISVKLTEESFTASLRQTVADAEKTLIDASAVQIAIDSDVGTELYIPVRLLGQKTALVIRLQIGFRDGSLAADIGDVRIGARRLPSWFARLLIKPPLEAGLTAFSSQLSQYVKLTGVETFDGLIRLNGELVVEELEIK